MAKNIKNILFVIAIFALSQPYTAIAADKKDVLEVASLIIQKAQDKERPNFFLSYMGFDYTTYVDLQEKKPKSIEVVAKTFYGTKEEFKTYTLVDEDLDGNVDSCIYQQGDVVKGTFDKHKEVGKDIHADCTSLYDAAIRFTLRKLKNK